ncbi:phage terminase large subunit family protein [Streptomyces prunicolor]|uniref:phage terminase large subunit family protein n=1 Tax=Streptomyces prunicolor TaxID=67348 RepID=UPI00037AECD5|nr:hypothetical protein [Streptomyces prunicolor]
MDPLLFAVIYLTHHVSNPDTGEITFAEAHEEWAELARQWARPGAKRTAENRHAFIAPRNLGKSTWWYLILPLWWAAYGYSHFTAAFANSDTQAQLHLKSFRNELNNNDLLRQDFPDLCKRKNFSKNSPEGDSTGYRRCGNGFVFMARGIDSQSLGMKVDQRRPDTILLDDIEPDEANYSLYQKAGRLNTLTDAILPLSYTANVVLTGTVTMLGSIVHDLVRAAKGEDMDWVKEESFKVHHHLPILDNGDGTDRSIWPGNPIFDLDGMKARRHTREFAKNMLNDPKAVDSEYWSASDFTYGTFQCSNTYLSIDGAVTTKKTSDYTGIAVVGVTSEPYRRALVKFSSQVKLKGAELRDYVLATMQAFPEVNCILVETNQGGDLWEEVLHDMPVRVKPVHNSVNKKERASRLLALYQSVPPRVVHAEPLHSLEQEMMQFPKGLFDDQVDATGNAVLRWIKPEQRIKAAMNMKHPR